MASIKAIFFIMNIRFDQLCITTSFPWICTHEYKVTNKQIVLSNMADEEDDLEVPINNDLERKIAEAFDVFDVSNSKMVDVRDVPTIIRGLGLCPSEAEIQEIIVQVEHPRIPGSVHLRHFLPIVVQIFTEHRYEPASPEELLEAFKTLDPKGMGYLTKEQITTYMTQDGEPFTQDEIDEMLELAIDPHSHTLPYEYYINQLIVRNLPVFFLFIQIVLKNTDLMGVKFDKESNK